MNEVTKTSTIEWYDHFNKVMRTREETIWIEPQPNAIICDWDAGGRRTFEKATGLGAQPAIKAVNEGINAVKERFKPNEQGEAMLYYMQDALVERDQSLVDALMPTCTIEEHPSYIWKVNSDGRKLDEPVKANDHGEDVDRYVVAFHDLKGKARATQM
jgi:hypothetical protein